MKNQNGNSRRTMDVVLIVIAIVLIVFTIAMVITYWHVGGVPDILITSVFAACLGECGFMAWIKNTKEKTGGYDYENYDGITDGLRSLYDAGDTSDQDDDGR